VNLAGQLAPTAGRDEAVSRAAGGWASLARMEATAWAENLPEGELRDRVSASVAISWADSNPSAAARWAIEKITPGSLRDHTLLAILQRWAMQEPEAAANWAALFPQGALHNSAANTLVSAWRRETY